MRGMSSVNGMMGELLRGKRVSLLLLSATEDIRSWVATTNNKLMREMRE